jgi:hypothetical protein
VLQALLQVAVGAFLLQSVPLVLLACFGLVARMGSREEPAASSVFCAAYSLWVLGPLALLLWAESVVAVVVALVLFLPWVFFPFYYTLVTCFLMYVVAVLPFFFTCNLSLFLLAIVHTVIMALHVYPLYIVPLVLGGPNPIDMLVT